MKILKLEKPTKSVKYFGLELEIPTSHNFVATDESGIVCSYAERPYTYQSCWEVENEHDMGYQVLAVVNLENLNWFESLKGFKNE